ncbi:FMN-linked oxidoreductase [Wolfiporia cocos MD-104 SS10]|uniref:FMN-linked oxidoreductase n=1 Tax=Wolfiporia cocos (strain MD-104) TaxID=742152 RepID=A0A2H3JQM1_WOLCO|nr:FMN-linked oxidoreductase [Wolfiporia cocos MD-104 SS10]
MEDIVSPAAANTSYFTPAQEPPAGTALYPQPDGKPIPKLFRPITIRGVHFQNRIMLSPLGQSSANNGSLTPWHSAHLGGILIYGPGLTFIEATAVLPEGRTSPEDSGLWDDSQIESLRKLVEFAHSQNQKIGMQLGHAGRKASTVAKWLAAENGASEAVGGWPNDVVAPSPIPYKNSPDYPKPEPLNETGIKRVVKAFADAAVRAVKAGVDVIDIHGAHGYLLHQFMSPVSNKRQDKYGGSFENRIRLALEVVDAVRAVIPADVPLMFRPSATDWLEEVAPDEPSWRCEDTVNLAEILIDHGVDLIDVSSAGLDSRQKIKFIAPAYQAHFAEAVKKRVGDRMLVASVGGIKDGIIAQKVLEKQGIDMVLVGRQFLRDHQSVWTFAEQLGVTVQLPNQANWVFRGRGSARRK